MNAPFQRKRQFDDLQQTYAQGTVENRVEYLKQQLRLATDQDYIVEDIKTMLPDLMEHVFVTHGRQSTVKGCWLTEITNNTVSNKVIDLFSPAGEFFTCFTHYRNESRFCEVLDLNLFSNATQQVISTQLSQNRNSRSIPHTVFPCGLHSLIQKRLKHDGLECDFMEYFIVLLFSAVVDCNIKLNSIGYNTFLGILKRYLKFSLAQTSSATARWIFDMFIEFCFRVNHRTQVHKLISAELFQYVILLIMSSDAMLNSISRMLDAHVSGSAMLHESEDILSSVIPYELVHMQHAALSYIDKFVPTSAQTDADANISRLIMKAWQMLVFPWNVKKCNVSDMFKDSHIKNVWLSCHICFISGLIRRLLFEITHVNLLSNDVLSTLYMVFTMVTETDDTRTLVKNLDLYLGRNSYDESVVDMYLSLADVHLKLVAQDFLHPTRTCDSYASVFAPHEVESMVEKIATPFTQAFHILRKSMLDPVRKINAKKKLNYLQRITRSIGTLMNCDLQSLTENSSYEAEFQDIEVYNYKQGDFTHDVVMDILEGKALCETLDLPYIGDSLDRPIRNDEVTLLVKLMVPLSRFVRAKTNTAVSFRWMARKVFVYLVCLIAFFIWLLRK
ncbi:hypothetical protein PCE1_001433 [Barthelona sp. PCE]